MEQYEPSVLELTDGYRRPSLRPPRHLPDDEDDEDLRCSFFGCAPGCLQWFHTSRWLLTVLSLCSFIQSFVVNSIFPVGLSTLERRFHMNSSQTGIISSWYDLANLVAVFPVCHWGNRGHKGRWIAAGCILMGLGSLVCALPHFTTPPYHVGTNAANKSDFGQCTQRGEKTCKKDQQPSDLSNYFYVFLLGQTLHGLGSTPLFSIGTTYIDIMWIFLALVFISVVASFASGIPTQQIILRVIPFKHRTLGIGVNWTILRLFGFIPGAILFGMMIDTTCLKWQQSCGERGSCLVYDPGLLSWTLFGIAVVCKIGSIAASIVGYMLYRPNDQDNELSVQTADSRGPLQLTVNDDRGRMNERMSVATARRCPPQRLLMATMFGMAVCSLLYLGLTPGTAEKDLGELKDQDFTKPALSMYILSNAPHAKIVNHTEEDKFPGLSLFYQETTPPFNIRVKGTVLLLHGAVYSSKTWSEEVGAPGPTTMQILAAAGYRVVAIDQPGFPHKTSGKLSQKPEEFIRDVVDVLQLGKPVIVSPSASGRFSLPFVSKYPDSVDAFIPIAPCCFNGIDDLDRNPTPTMIVHGELDGNGKPNAHLISMPNSNVFIVPNAPHAAYLAQPALFHAALVNFLNYIHQ
uniref:Uncharacterized protein n=1 Tax=Plectus sambesii TaxID=2011161 RepID=A0A914X2S5_9BILA